MEQVSRLITQSRTAATDTVTEMQRVIDSGEAHPDRSLTDWLEGSQDSAEYEWAHWRDFARSINPYDPSAGLVVEYHNETVAELYGPEYTAPPALAQRIKAYYVEAVGEAAVTTQEALVGIVAEYRHLLMDYGTQLGGLGYDLSGGPMDLWTSEEMARFAAEQISAADPGDTGAMRPYLGTLQSLIDASEGGRTLTAAEREYLDVFLNNIEEGQLVAIGRAGADAPAVYPGMPGWASISGTERTPAETLANGIMLLNDPERLGTGQDYTVLPNELDLLRPRYHENGAALDPGASDGREYLQSYDDVALFLSQATIPPSDLMAREMGDSALYTQELYTRNEEYRGGVPNPGADRLLETVARSPEASAGLLADKEFAYRLFDQQWENSVGAASLVTSGTTYPDDLPDEERGESRYDTARDHVTRIGMYDYDAVASGRGSSPMDVQMDHSDLEAAVQPLLPRYQVPLPPD
ncbi:hypothetical protein [Streptomyces avicenniae]|uniref:hypothetical protein n=1 Tax=Streptomyces avicenniae TaxID=500153 RepID=UPI00069A9058|nr:hypothetical protein [Streptomyces avicenniae]